MKKARALKISPFFNRELSWLAFNDRVLEESNDIRYPILERLKFISIVSSNLDEFFMIRVAGLERKARRTPHSHGPDGLTIEEVLSQIRDWVLAQKAKQGLSLKDVLDALRLQGLYLQLQIQAGDAEILDRALELLPPVTVQTFTKLDELHQLTGGKIYVFVRLNDRFAVLSLPDSSNRLLRIPESFAQAPHHYVLAERLLSGSAQKFFPGETLLEVFSFKLIRDADFKIDPDTDPEDLLTTVEEALEARGRRPVVRLEIDAPQIGDGALLIANAFKLHSRALYRYDLPMDLKILWRLYNDPLFERLRFHETKNIADEDLQRVPDLVKLIRGQDVILHHPYDSFETVVRLIQAAVKDPDVVGIRQTLYRTNKGSSIVEALIEAAQTGKNVTVFVELRARFDERHNIALAKKLKKYGVKVLLGYPDKKIHCKMTQILRKEGSELRSFVHIGTGNYNPSTARLYTDVSLLTSNASFGRDVERIFKHIRGGKLPNKLEALIPAPLDLHKKLLLWIRNEVRHAKTGAIGPDGARIIVKVNSLVDTELIEALYKASQAGVKVDLIVRGICVLRPGVPGLSDNIRVVSIVDRYLEHSRIYYFQNGSHPLIYLSSADWMPRNFHTRLEVAFPILEAPLKKYMKEYVLETYLKDNQKARQLMPNGEWTQIQPGPEEKAFRAQEFFERIAKENYKGTPLATRFRLQKTDAIELDPSVKGPLL